MHRFEYSVVLYGFYCLLDGYLLCHYLRPDALVEAYFVPLVQTIFPCNLFVLRWNRKGWSDARYAIAGEYFCSIFDFCQYLI